MKRRLQAILLGAVSLHLLWVLLAWLINNLALPYPWLVYQHLPSLLTGEMLAHLGLSALRVLLGILYSLLIAIPIAAGVLYPFTGTLLNPMIAAVAMTMSSITVVLNSQRLLR